MWRFLFALSTVSAIWLGIAAPVEKRIKAHRHRRILDIDDAVKRKEHERNHYIGYLTDQVTYETWPEMKVQNVEDGCRIWVKVFVPRSTLSNLIARMGDARLKYEIIDDLIEDGQPQLINVAVLMCSLPDRSRGHTRLNFIRSPKLNCVYLIKRPHRSKRYFHIFKESCRTLSPVSLVELKSFNTQEGLNVGALSDNCLAELPVQPQLLRPDGMSTNKGKSISESFHTSLPYLQPSGEQSTTIPEGKLQTDLHILQIDGQSINKVEDIHDDFLTNLQFHSQLSHIDAQSTNNEANKSESFQTGLPYLHPSGEQATTSRDNLQIDPHLLQLNEQSLNKVNKLIEDCFTHLTEDFYTDFPFHSQLTHIEGQPTNKDGNISDDINTGFQYLHPSDEQATTISGNKLQNDPHLWQTNRKSIKKVDDIFKDFLTDFPLFSQLSAFDGPLPNKEENLTEDFHKGLPNLQPSGGQSTSESLTISGDNLHTTPHLLQIDGRFINEMEHIPEDFFSDLQLHSHLSHIHRQSTNEVDEKPEDVFTDQPSFDQHLHQNYDQPTSDVGVKIIEDPHFQSADELNSNNNETALH